MEEHKNKTHTICPGCGGQFWFPNEGLGMTAPCPHCGLMMDLKSPSPKGIATNLRAKSETKPESYLPIGKPPGAPSPSRAASPAEQIAALAETFSMLAKIALFIGMAALVISITIADHENAKFAWLVMAGLFVSSFWLYLLAQIIHIRANTEK